MKVRFTHIVGYRVYNHSDEGCLHKKDFIGLETQEIGINYTCEKCGQVFYANTGCLLYNTDSGRPEPGDAFWADYYPENWDWDNHKGPHLIVVLPNGDHWNIDSRASNCASPNDRTHRCWVRHGSPEDGTLHVDKNGLTCSAGGGSIDMGGWHGFLHYGDLHLECTTENHKQ